MPNKHFTPPGWTYNPSTFMQRVPIVILALIGCAISVYLALFQYKIIQDVWEPFFGDGSRKILTSPTSFILPISDAALGAMAYLVDALTGIVGGKARWQTMPWIVIIFGFFVGPLSGISIALVIAQPVLYDHWCTLCLLSALIAIIMVGPSMDEVLASMQYLKRVKKNEPREFWPAFWGKSVRPVTFSILPRPEENKLLVWPLWICMGASLWLMALPDIYAYSNFAANVHHILGPLVFTFSCVALWETSRPLRYLNIVAAFLLMGLLWGRMTAGENFSASMAAAWIIIIFSLMPVPYFHKFSGGWRALLRKRSRNLSQARIKAEAKHG